jgi:hypothetical protein
MPRTGRKDRPSEEPWEFYGGDIQGKGVGKEFVGTLGHREILQASKKPQIGRNAGEAKESRGVREKGI